MSDTLDPITGIGELFIDVGEGAPAGWSVLSRTASGREANLNKGTGGRKIQLCFTRARGQPPLTDLAVVCRQPGQGFDPHDDFTIVEQTVGGRRANLNEGSGGAQLYIAYRRCQRPAVSAAAAAVAALDSGEVAKEEEERAPIVDLAVLYTTLADGHLLASANVIGEGYLMVRNMVRDQKGRTVTQAPADMNAGSHRLLQKLRNLDTPWNHTRQSEVRLYYKKRSTRRQRPTSTQQQNGVVWPSKVGHASPDDIHCVRQLGDGAVGSIWLVRYGAGDPASRSAHGPSPSRSGLYALKILRKERMIRKGKVERVMNELNILRTVDHPFVVTLHASFQTPHFLCHMMEYCPGGNLYDLLQAQPHRCLIEEHARFYAAQIISGLEYLHYKGYIYRDMKPENILLAESGHVRLSDFDLSQVAGSSKPVQMLIPFNAEVLAHAKKQQKKRAAAVGGGGRAGETESLFDERDPSSGARFNSFVGTVEYVAPEVLDGTGHSFSVDFWIFGVLLYEMLYGATPFLSQGNSATFARIRSTQYSFPSPAPREGPGINGFGGEGKRGAVSRDCKGLIAAVLVADPSQRLGYARGAPEIKSHGWFRGLRWALLRDEAPPLLVVDPARAAEEEASVAGFPGGLEPLNSVLARLQADGILADADSPAVTRWTVGRESSEGDCSADGFFEDHSGFGIADGPVGQSSTRAGGGAGGYMTQRSGAGKGRATTPRLTAAESDSLFADFNFNGLETVRDAYGRDVTPVRSKEITQGTGSGGGDAMLQPDAPAAGMDGGSDVAVGVKVKARAHVAAQMGRENPPKKLEQLPKSGVDNYACTAEC